MSKGYTVKIEVEIFARTPAEAVTEIQERASLGANRTSFGVHTKKLVEQHCEVKSASVSELKRK